MRSMTEVTAGAATSSSVSEKTARSANTVTGHVVVHGKNTTTGGLVTTIGGQVVVVVAAAVVVAVVVVGTMIDTERDLLLTNA